MTNQKLKIDPSKMVAGLEPEITNAWLQQMYSAATSKQDSFLHIQQILNSWGQTESERNDIIHKNETERKRKNDEIYFWKKKILDEQIQQSEEILSQMNSTVKIFKQSSLSQRNYKLEEKESH